MKVIAGLSLIGLLLSGCATVDRFGDRALTFNDQMQKNRRAGILENILRAGDGEPLQFTDVTTVTGTGSGEASLGADLPFFGTRAGGARLFSFSPSLTASGGPSFTVASQNGQEFLNGLNKPLPNQIIPFYASSERMRLAILLMTVAAIDYDLDGKHYHFEANAENSGQLKLFQSAVLSLIAKGLYYEKRDEVDYVGPPLTADEVKGGVLTALLRSTGDKTPSLGHFVASEPDGKAAFDALTPIERAKMNGATEFYRLTSTSSKVHFCFATPLGNSVGAFTALGAAPTLVSTVLGRSGGEDLTFIAGGDLQCGSTSKTPAGAKKFTLTLRSVRGIFALLGAMARAELKGGGGANMFDFPYDGKSCRLFGVAVDPDADADLAPRRRIKTTDGDCDLSGTTIALLAELIALNSSAKDLPAPSIIPLIRN